MSVAVYLPLVASLLVAPKAVVLAVRSLPNRIPPRWALWLLSGSALLLSTATTVALGLLAASALVQLPLVAELGQWRPAVLAQREPGAVPVGAAAALVLAGLLGHGLLVASRIARRYRRVARETPGVAGAGGAGDVLVLDDVSPYAVARPRLGRRPGQVVVSSGMLAGLGERERAALIAHERAHLAGHHHVVAGVGALTQAVNPLLSPLCREVTYAMERCADEVAVTSVGDREVVARAVGRAALLAHGGESGVPSVDLGMTSGPVPRRVSALLLPVPASNAGRWWRAVALAVVAVAAMAAALHAGVDLHAVVETAEVRCGAA